jgi:hypothetical protein
MQQIPFWEANNHSATQDIPRLSWNQKVHYRVYKSRPLAPTLSQMNPVHILSPYFPKVHSNLSPHLHLGPPSGLFPSGFPTQILYAFLISLMRATRPPISSFLIWPP